MNWSEATSSIVLSNRQFLYNYFSQVLWSGSSSYWPISSLQSNSHVFFFCFYKSFPITLKRLLENCLYEPDCYKNFTIICLPYQDIISQLPSKQSSIHLLENAYLLYYHSLLSSFLFSPPLKSSIILCFTLTFSHLSSKKRVFVMKTLGCGVYGARTRDLQRDRLAF